MRCDWEIIGEPQDGKMPVKCTRCKERRAAIDPSKYFRTCPMSPRGDGSPVVHAGTALTIVFDEIGVHEPGGCGCKSVAREMNSNGVEWCKENVAYIVEQIEANAKKMDWSTYLVNSAKVAAAGYLSLRAIVEEAIRRAEVDGKLTEG